MIVEETYLRGCFVITPRIFKDNRGEFFESFNKEQFEKLTHVKTTFVQDNQSKSQKGTLRGLHLQVGDFEQAKLVRVVHGKALDVCVDLRPNSKTFGKYFSIVLDSEENKQLFVPRGFAHGFITLSDSLIFNYKCDNYYNKSSERGIIYNDTTLNIDWQLDKNDFILSEKDKTLPSFKTFLNGEKY